MASSFKNGTGRRKSSVARVMICPGDTVETLTHRIQRAEYRLLPLVINQLCN